ncbi:MAG TPA: hypothetical protein VLE53_14535, partial [Gemmatimonadaceae bacterium]|nr:hypothetical protein [Gemmatimonadaceae bacterium]
MSLAARYHDLLTPDLADASHTHLEHAQRRRGLVFGDRALCTVLRPRFMRVADYRDLQSRVGPLLRAFARVYERAVHDRDFRAQFGLSDWEEVLVATDPGYVNPSPTSRLDCFAAPASAALGLTEYNAETPAGAGYSDALSEAFLDLPLMREFARTHEILPLPAAPGVVGVLLEAWHEFSGTRTPPRVAILDWRDVPTSTEFDLFQQHFLSLGIECFIEDPRHAEYENRRLYVGGTAVDLVYKRVLISELVERCGLDCPVIRAVRDREV